MAEYRIENETIAIMVNSFGAEMKSLKKKATGREYLWCADPEYWGRTSPVLFPFVGGVRNKEYRTKGQTYSMGQHGFARDMEFEPVSQSAGELWFALSDTEETLAKYPYAFCLKIGYRLKENGVEVVWEVENPGNEVLPFSIGGHPAFNCEMPCGISMDGDEHKECTRIRGGLATAERVPCHFEKGYLPVTEHLFDDDALVFENGQAKRVALCTKEHTPFLTVEMNAPLFGVWSPPGKNAPFICIEPWYGRCDGENFDGELKDREWGNLLAPGAVWRASYSILV